MFPAPQQLLITGESAGAFAAAALAQDVLEAYQDCPDVTVLSDSASLCSPRWKQVVNEIWQAPVRIAAGVQGDNILVDLYRQLVRREGNRLRYLFCCGYEDGCLAMFQNYVDTGVLELTPAACARFRENLARQIQALKQLGVPFSVYIHEFRQPDGLVQHTTLASPTFLNGQSEGISPMDWLWQTLQGRNQDVGLALLQNPKEE